MIKRKSRKKEEFSKSKARNELHKIWSIKVRERDGYACQWCRFEGRSNINRCHHAHHIVARSICLTNGSYDVDNGMTLCFYCHIQRLKSYPDEYIVFRDEWIKEELNMDYQWLRDKFRPVVKFTKEFYELKKGSLEAV